MSVEKVYQECDLSWEDNTFANYLLSQEVYFGLDKPLAK